MQLGLRIRFELWYPTLMHFSYYIDLLIVALQQRTVVPYLPPAVLL